MTLNDPADVASVVASPWTGEGGIMRVHVSREQLDPQLLKSLDDTRRMAGTALGDVVELRDELLATRDEINKHGRDIFDLGLRSDANKSSIGSLAASLDSNLLDIRRDIAITQADLGSLGTAVTADVSRIDGRILVLTESLAGLDQEHTNLQRWMRAEHELVMGKLDSLRVGLWAVLVVAVIAVGLACVV